MPSERARGQAILPVPARIAKGRAPRPGPSPRNARTTTPATRSSGTGPTIEAARLQSAAAMAAGRRSHSSRVSAQIEMRRPPGRAMGTVKTFRSSRRAATSPGSST